MSDTDRIEKQVVLKAPRTRVWRALTDSGEFGKWFGMTLDGGFTVGRTVGGHITHQGTQVRVTFTPEKIEPETRFSYRWHPFAMDPKVDYSGEPTTLVEFRLEEAPEGTLLTVVESGFDRIPKARRDEAFRMNDRGWTAELKNIQRHVEG
jgi:uncharacterized protein YndB with AHSA1/START domain